MFDHNLLFVTGPKNHLTLLFSFLYSELKESSSHLIVGTPGAMLQLNAASCTLEQYVDLQGLYHIELVNIFTFLGPYIW